MNGSMKREQLVALVREKDQIEAEQKHLAERNLEIDARIDALLKAPERAAPDEPKAAAPKAKKQAKAKRAASPKKAKTESASQAPSDAKPAKAEKNAAAPKKQKKTKRGAMKKRLLGLLGASPQGVDVSVLAKEVYGGDDKTLRAKCESYLYNLARQKLVTHKGSMWELVSK